ncbi:MAG: UPF0280 family protein [Dehalococcoidia bacterium]|nr:MAG: UPF0280 family protein [Dehalococcoidia bacterium]
MYQPRFYRDWIRDKDLFSFNVVVKETDLYVRARRNLKRKTLKAASKYRALLEKYIERHPEFLTALEPIGVGEDAPQIVKAMAEAAKEAGVGPMASVAGAIAEYVGKELLPFSSEVIVENGGDIFLKTLKRRMIGIYAGESSFTGKITLEIQPGETPLGICTSSGTVGHSLSFGRADACIVLSPSTPLADAAATAIGNLTVEASDIPRGIDFAKGVEGIKGIVIIKDDQIGIWGEVEILPVEG